MAAKAADSDVAIVGASLAGCTAAILLSRAGATVALIEKQPDPKAFKRVCSHFIQASAVPTIERLGLYEPILEAGGLRSRFHSRTPWGWVEPTERREAYCLNLRRSLLDPMLREAAAAQPNVELMLGQSAERLIREGDRFGGVGVRERDGNTREIRARLVVGADGRDSRVAEMAEVKEKTLPQNRLAYGGYFEGPKPRFWPDGAVWLLDPDMAAAFPTDGGQVFYIAMVHKDRAPEFKADPERALVEHVAADPREQVRGAGDRQDRDAQPDPRADRSRPGVDRRRRPRYRSALRGRLRLRLPVRRMAGRQRLPRPPRRRVARQLPAPLSQAPSPTAGDACPPHPRLRDGPEVRPVRTGDDLDRRSRPSGGRPLRGGRHAPQAPPGDAFPDGPADRGGPSPAPDRPVAGLSREARFGAGLGLGGLDLAILRRRGGDKVVQQLSSGIGHRRDGLVEGLLVCLRRLGRAADLAHVLQRRGLDLLVGRGWIEVMEGSDVSAHASILSTIREEPARPM